MKTFAEATGYAGALRVVGTSRGPPSKQENTMFWFEDRGGQ
jgi:hypothetical protein